MKYVSVFKNSGQAAGTSIVHTHSQVIAYNLLPKIIEEKGFLNNIPVKTNAAMGDAITQDGFEVMLKSFQTNLNWTSQVNIAVKNVDNEEKQFESCA